MIAYIYGTLLEKLETSVVIDTGGIGYEVFVAGNSNIWHKSKGDEVVLHTAQIFKEDDASLYGFEGRDGLRLFKLLITVSGIGAKAAMAILSQMTTEEAVRAIAFEDVAALTRAQGVGKKSAERVVLDLKDKVVNIVGGVDIGRSPAGVGEGEQLAIVDIVTEAINLLMSLGISRSEAGQAVMNVREDYETVEDCVRLALKGL